LRRHSKAAMCNPAVEGFVWLNLVKKRICSFPISAYFVPFVLNVRMTSHLRSS